MAKHTVPTIYLTKDGDTIVESNSFIYSITLDIYYPKEKRYERSSTKYISSPTLLSFKNKNKIDKSDKNKIRFINVEWEAAPSKYIADNKLQQFKNEKKNGRNKD